MSVEKKVFILAVCSLLYSTTSQAMDTDDRDDHQSNTPPAAALAQDAQEEAEQVLPATGIVMLGNDQVGNEGVQALAPLTNLTVLNLGNNNIGPAGAQVLLGAALHRDQEHP